MGNDFRFSRKQGWKGIWPCLLRIDWAISVCFQTIKVQAHVGTYSPSLELTSSESRVLWLWLLVRQDFCCQYLGLRSRNWSEALTATPSGRNFRHLQNQKVHFIFIPASVISERHNWGSFPQYLGYVCWSYSHLVRSWFVDWLNSSSYFLVPSLHSWSLPFIMLWKPYRVLQLFFALHSHFSPALLHVIRPDCPRKVLNPT